MGQTIGDRLRSERLRIGFSQGELARRAEVSKAYLSQLEAGSQDNPSIGVLQRIAKALDITLGKLVGTEGVRVPTAAMPPLKDPGLLEFLEEEQRRGQPVPEADVELLSRLQWRGGMRPRTKQQWAVFLSVIRGMWDQGGGAE